MFVIFLTKWLSSTCFSSRITILCYNGRGSLLFCFFVCVFVFSSLCLMYSCNSCATPFCSHSNCGIPDPSWAEIRHFVSFLNSQLRDCEQSFFCDMQLMRSVLAGPNVLNLEGFRSFVVRFMIQMSRVRYCNNLWHHESLCQFACRYRVNFNVPLQLILNEEKVET